MGYHNKEGNSDPDPIEIQFTMEVTQALQWYIYCAEEDGVRLRESYKDRDVRHLLLDFYVCQIQCLEMDEEALKMLQG